MKGTIGNVKYKSEIGLKDVCFSYPAWSVIYSLKFQPIYIIYNKNILKRDPKTLYWQLLVKMLSIVDFKLLSILGNFVAFFVSF